MAQADDIRSYRIADAVPGGDPSDTDSFSETGIKTPHINDGAVTGPKIADGAVKASHLGMYGNIAIVAPEGGDYTDPAVAMDDYATWCGAPSGSNPCLLKIMPGVYDVGAAVVTMQSYIDIEGSGVTTTRVVGNGNWVVIGSTVSNAELRALTVENANASSTSYVYGLALDGFYGRLTDVDVEIFSAPVFARGIGFVEGAPVLRRVGVNVIGAFKGRAEGIYADRGLGRWADVDVSVSSTSADAYVYGLYGFFASGSVEIYNSRFEATSGSTSRGVYGRNMILDKCTVFASGGTEGHGLLVQAGYSARVLNSRIVGNTCSISADGVADVHGAALEGQVCGNAYVGNSKIVGGASSSVVCAGVYDDGYTFYANTCP